MVLLLRPEEFFTFIYLYVVLVTHEKLRISNFIVGAGVPGPGKVVKL